MINKQAGCTRLVTGRWFTPSEIDDLMPEETILLVEDNLVNQKLLLLILKPHGYRVLTAQDGEEAVQLALHEQPDLILMDLQLPKMNGMAAAQVLKGQPETGHIPIVALTAHTVDSTWRCDGTNEFYGVITKPIDTREFPAQVRRFLDQPHQP